MQTTHRRHPDTNDDVLCGLAGYSSDLVPLGRVAMVAPPHPPERTTIAGRSVTVEPNPTVRYALDGADLVVSESMTFHAAPTENRVIRNLPARRLMRAARHATSPDGSVALNGHAGCK